VSSLRIVLVRPRNAQNVRSIQKTLSSFRDAELVVVSEEEHFEQLWRSEEAKLPLPAQRGEGRGEGPVPRRVDTLSESLVDCALIVGTTMRERPGLPRWSSRELATHVARRAPSRWALVFGTEANGLQNADLKHCTATCFIPADPDQPSLNLSQAVVLFAHELSMPVETGPRAPLADERAWRRLRVQMRERLGVTSVERVALLAPLLRADLSDAEVELWSRALS
jgi:tRNA C32,U32 (ribose-2'-O)-methylase TrmJ